MTKQEAQFRHDCAPSHRPAIRPLGSAIQTENGNWEPVSHQHPCAELNNLNESQLLALSNVELAEKFVAMLRWVDDSKTAKAKLRRHAVLMVILGVDNRPDITWTKIGQEQGCSRKFICKLAAQFKRLFGPIRFGPYRESMRDNHKGGGSFQSPPKNR